MMEYLYNGKNHKELPGQQSVEMGVGDSYIMDKSNDKQKMSDIKKKLAEMSSEKWDLQDQLQSLEERLAEQVQRSESGSVRRCSETLQVKDQYISKLATELKVSQLHIAQLKSRHKKKLKTLNTQLSEVKQAASIELFELKDKITRLVEENEKLSMAAVEGVHAVDSTPDQPQSNRGHMSLILDLSQQVSEQQEKITILEATLKEKNKEIKQLQSSAGSPSRQNIPQNQDGGSPDQCSPARRNSNFLSTGWPHFISDDKNHQWRNSALTPVEEDGNSSRNEMNASRDSGFGSAGKTKGSKDGSKLVSSKRIGSGSSILSELTMSASESDSDWGSDLEITPPNKVQSAPPGLRSPHLLPPGGDSGEDNWSADSRNGSAKGKRRKKSHLRFKADQRTNPDGLPVSRSEMLEPTPAFL